MKVNILFKSDHWLDACWVATRTCKSKMTPQELANNAVTKPHEDKVRLMKAIFKAGHLSIFEHASVTFGVSGVSRALLAQFTRHRIGWSYSVQSQRYVKMSDTLAVLPVSVETTSVPSISEETAKLNAIDVYKKSVADAMSGYNDLLSMGVPAEDARMLLPMGIQCNIVTSCNLRALLDIYHKRVEVKGAQWEIREMVSRMMELVCETEPWVRELVGE